MSRTRRFFVADLGSETVELSPEEAHHLADVLRMSEGMEVRLFDGKGRAASAEIVRIAGGTVTLRVLAASPSRESPLALGVGVAVPKGDRMALVVQKLTELGVQRIVPLLTERGEVSRSACERSLSRWRRVALEASKQCQRSRIPELDSPRTLDELLGEPGSLVLLAQPGAAPAPDPLPRDATVLALVGPEGGWSDDELALAAVRGVQKFGLGPRILRTETAAIATAALLQWIAGDWRVHDS